jgi:inorganic pyrophosphatase
MIHAWHGISDDRILPERFLAVIEIPKGGKQKYELDKETGMLRLDRILSTSTHFPANYGFIPRTLAEDGDPMDVLVLCSETLQSMCLVECYPIGIFSMTDNGQLDEKIIAIPFDEPQMNGWRDIHDLPRHVFSEIQHFFKVYKSLDAEKTSIPEVEDAVAARKVIAKSIEAYAVKFGKNRE